MFEFPFRRLPALIEALRRWIAPYTERAYAFFGHSMGALISFELCRHLRRNGQKLPAGLFVSGRWCPHLRTTSHRSTTCLIEAFLHELRELNGSQKRFWNTRNSWRWLSQSIRADFEICETYDYVPEPPLDLPILAFGGLFDQEVSRQDVDAWRQHTTDRFSLSMLPGDHFFIDSARQTTLQRLLQELLRLQPAPRR